MTEYSTEFEDVKERIYNVEKGKSEKYEATRILEKVYGNGIIVTYRAGISGVYGWEDGKRKGRTRRAVINNYLRKQNRTRNDRQGETVERVSVTLGKIKKSNIKVAVAQTENSASDKDTPLLSIISILDLIKNINSNNGNFLKYIPSQLLNENQIKSKNDALQKEKRRLNELKLDDNYNLINDAKYSLKDGEGNALIEEQQKFFADSKVRDEEGWLIPVYHGSKY